MLLSAGEWARERVGLIIIIIIIKKRKRERERIWSVRSRCVFRTLHQSRMPCAERASRHGAQGRDSRTHKISKNCQVEKDSSFSWFLSQENGVKRQIALILSYKIFTFAFVLHKWNLLVIVFFIQGFMKFRAA